MCGSVWEYGRVSLIIGLLVRFFCDSDVPLRTRLLSAPAIFYWWIWHRTPGVNLSWPYPQCTMSSPAKAPYCRAFARIQERCIYAVQRTCLSSEDIALLYALTVLSYYFRLMPRSLIDNSSFFQITTSIFSSHLLLTTPLSTLLTSSDDIESYLHYSHAIFPSGYLSLISPQLIGTHGRRARARTEGSSLFAVA